MLWQMPHVSVCDSHNSLPQSKHCVLAVLEQGSPSSSAEFLTSMISHCAGIRFYDSNSAQANTQECQPATGSLWRSHSNKSSLPSFWEYSRFRILNQVLCSRSVGSGSV